MTDRRSSGPGRAGVLALALVAVVAGIYWPILGNGYVWDDTLYIVNNRHVTGGLTPENLRWAFTSFEAGNWHPLTWLSHMLDVELFGPGPRGPHLVNLLLHGANSALLFAVLRGMTGALWSSLLVAALFAAHPLHVESVAWAAERKDLLSTLLAFLAIGAHLRHARRPGRLRFLAVAALFGCGLAAKPMLVTLPLLLLLLDFWPLGRLGPTGWRPAVLEKIPLLALSAASSAVTFAAQAGAGAVSDYGPAARVSNALVSYARYLGTAAFPDALAVFYPHPESAWPLWQTLGAALLLALTTLFALLQLRRRPYLACGWFWYLGTLVPVIGLVQVGQQALADRYTYVPLVGVFLAAAWAAGELARRRPRARAPLAAAAVAALAALAVASSRQTTVWRDPVALFTHAAEKAPGNWMAHYNLGFHYQERGQTEAAIGHYRAAIAARGDYENALNNLGVLVAARGNSAEAMGYYQRAIAVAPGYAKAHNNLGVELARQRRFGEAEAAFRQAVRLDPGTFNPHQNLADALARQGRWAEALAEYSAAAAIDPGAASARNGAGVCLASLGRHAEALAQFREALRLDPGNADALKNSARTLALMGR